ncbi:MAG: phospholipase D-like domain-containing protein [Candidatus Diapherotrites archaeon]|nr:phospholipase D-like domain-containing protein [Candidatus Diapherotrites archaeon]
MSKTNIIIALLIFFALLLSFGMNFLETNSFPQIPEGTKPKIFFCPEDNCLQEVLDKINSSQESIYCMMYSLTSDEVGNALISAHDKGISLELILDSQQITENSEFEKIEQAGVQVIKDKNPQLMHNKFCVFDKKVVTTGSVNFTQNGFERNNENLVIIEDEEIALQYLQEFEKFWNEWS